MGSGDVIEYFIRSFPHERLGRGQRYGYPSAIKCDILIHTYVFVLENLIGDRDAP